MATNDEMKMEAISRMKMLKMHENPIKEFEEEGRLNKSEGGILFWLNEEEEKMVKEFEERSGCMVYHAVHSFTDFGELYTLMYVSEYEEEWEVDRKDIEAGYPLCYVVNKTTPDFSEFGSCGIKPLFGGLYRYA